MRVLVTGGRNYTDVERIYSALDALGVTLLIHGGASGADTEAGRWADFHGVPCMVFPAPWAHHGRAAGPIRNGWMLEYGRPDLVVAFPGGRGTANMVKQARDRGVEVREVPA